MESSDENSVNTNAAFYTAVSLRHQMKSTLDESAVREVLTLLY